MLYCVDNELLNVLHVPCQVYPVKLLTPENGAENEKRMNFKGWFICGSKQNFMLTISVLYFCPSVIKSG
ncbi:hypothetical protein D0C36_10975 [Mucilaginibacter conchicola]|uniref:Uncharacterized protein n=1 Tax=Mucilaginibacter conchicola TaxID=2303333 RepID=A0A372NRQ8_9SPHI|nr:hypothetical protein D0C36_10975 [Mucilaginibacter conchicola]